MNCPWCRAEAWSDTCWECGTTVPQTKTWMHEDWSGVTASQWRVGYAPGDIPTVPRYSSVVRAPGRSTWKMIHMDGTR